MGSAYGEETLTDAAARWHERGTSDASERPLTCCSGPLPGTSNDIVRMNVYSGKGRLH